MIDSALMLMDVVDRGVPNLERIPIKVEEDFYLQYQWIGIGIKQPNSHIFPINDNSMWLGMGWVKKGDWIFVYTGKGEPRSNRIPGLENSIYTVHWNREATLFSSDEIHPYLLEGLVSLPPAFNDAPQQSGLFLETGQP
ncbi:hypothetical protein [uncultured Ruegeria sp.]|uniref:hypothetical protein n=1 Tax=uncultured Ruegeria sp. TaxID=259304 RepID=UPI00260872D4|nr:hypothetical protein [uncultured Ruegeria sp.]